MFRAFCEDQPPTITDIINNTVRPNLAQREISLQEIDLSDFRMRRPNYISLCHFDEKLTKISFEPKFKHWLEITIRGILDSKFYEHLICSFETDRTPSRFVEFLYAWLGNFGIEEGTR